MASLTVRDIPAGLMDRLRALSARERRSLNSEILIVLEAGLRVHVAEGVAGHAERVSRNVQLALWEQLAGKWEDERETSEIIADIRGARTPGREVSL